MAGSLIISFLLFPAATGASRGIQKTMTAAWACSVAARIHFLMGISAGADSSSGRLGFQQWRHAHFNRRRRHQHHILHAVWIAATQRRGISSCVFFIGVIMLIVAMLTNIFLQIPAMALAISSHRRNDLLCLHSL
ncbi:MAG: hypothetical protein M5R42_05450 [Rhodocyclaceae bacterium]|nr:hypothetical protein [Rhodocyclaceae bacterium]